MARVVEQEDDFYAVLGVDQSAPLETIREAYKKLALRYHPDKNRDASATSDFQLLVRAWDTLKDGLKRGDYDSSYAGILERRRHQLAREEAERLRRRREALRREEEERWARARDENLSAPHNTDTHDRVTAWHAVARKDYLDRVETWKAFRRERVPEALKIHELWRQQEESLAAQSAESEDQVIATFRAAIRQSCISGRKFENQEQILAQLLHARQIYLARVTENITKLRAQSAQLRHDLESARQSYEHEEGRVRALRVRRALEFLGPRELFSLIDRRGEAINSWQALSRIAPATLFHASLGPPDEGPWHVSGEWPRVSGEQTCDRCGEDASHLIPELSASQCPGCRMIACSKCYRSLKLLQEYEAWITSPSDVAMNPIFSILFDIGMQSSVKPEPASAKPDYVYGYQTSGVC